MIPAHRNPFRVERLHTLPFEPQGTTWHDLMRRLAHLNYRAAIVGPHGSGKTTLLAQLAPRLAALGYTPRELFRNSEGGRAMPPHWCDTLRDLRPTDILLADGYGHLGPLSRLRLREHARKHAAGLIVTAHRRCALPTLIWTRTDPSLLARLVSHLHGDLDASLIASLHARHRGNLRDALRELYDLHATAPL